ncbi:MAG TPA: PilZ domain-containing protein [bacterium]
MADASQRKNERVPFTGPVRFRKPAAMDGKGIDIAPGGMGAEAPQPVAVGTPVEIELFGGTVVPGVVKMSAALPGGGVRLGIQFASEDPSLVAKAKG